MFVIDALATWLVEQAADAARRTLSKGWRDDPRDAALRRAAANAIELTANDFFGEDPARTDQLALAIEQVFSLELITEPRPGMATALDNLRTGVMDRVSILANPDITGQGISAAANLGVAAEALGQQLINHLIQQIKDCGLSGGTLQPLAIQINFDQSHEHGERVESNLAEIHGKLERVLASRTDYTYLSEHYRLLLQERRQDASGWCTQILANNQDDFWETDWRERLHPIVDIPQSLALTARGGSGKSVLAAHMVRHLLQSDQYSCPIVLSRPEDFRGGIEQVRRLVGARTADELSRYVSTMRTADHRVLFVVDGLDALIHATSTQVMTALLKELADLSCLLVTCRTEVWQRYFARLGIEHNIIGPLSGAVVQRILSPDILVGQSNLPVLQLPFYLNAAIMLASDFEDIPSTETGLLQGLLRHYGKPMTTPLPQSRGFESIFDRLAELQLNSTSYEVSRNALLAATQAFRGAGRAIEYLEEIGIIREHASGRQLTVRLNHDLLDCFNIARLLIDYDLSHQQRQRVYDHVTELAGWTVMSMLVQISHVTGNEALLRELFGELLKMLDRKHLGEDWMGRAWAATYVLRDKVAILMPLILECLNAPEATRPDQPDSPNVSRLGPDARITQEAASSLASAFDALDNRTASRPDEAIPVLSRSLYRWGLRKRFVEALAKYREPAAVDALTTFARNILTTNSDPALLGEVAEALGNVGETLNEVQRNLCSQILEEIVAASNVDARTRRATIEAMNKLTWPIVTPVPDIDEAEIITYLDPVDHGRNDYSDWRVVKRYAEYVYDRIVNGLRTQALLDALLLAFTHDQVFVRTAVAACLGIYDDPAARAALLEELLAPSLPWDVREACLEALDAQIREAKSPAQRALYRWVVLHAAHQAAELELPCTSGLADLVAKWWDAGEPIVTRGAFEVLPALTPSDATVALSIQLIPAEAAPIAAWIRDLISPDDYASVGEGWEPKYRPVAVGRPDSNSHAITVAPTTWEESASFHRAMIRQQASLRYSADRIISSWLRGDTTFPGIICIHSIVVTGDSRIVMARRGESTIYASGRWSVSFEEQMTSADFQSAIYDAVTSAALRGFSEEFELPVDTCRVRVVSPIIEFPITNLSILVVIETEETSAAFERAITATSVPQRELTEIQFVGLVEQELLSQIQRSDLHPTSAVRMQALLRLYDRDLPYAQWR